jgi:TRAP-type C4-dicarboxylate transport system permease large subunit
LDKSQTLRSTLKTSTRLPLAFALALGLLFAGVIEDVSVMTLFKGVLPFIATDILRLIILISFPAITLWLPGKMG